MNKFNKSSNKLTLYIGSDHAGYEMKQKIISDSRLKNFDFIDVGTNSNDSVDYPDYASILANNVLKNKGYGIAICGTGIGISVALNKIKGIYTAVINDPNVAKLAREHNNLNVISLSGRFSTVDNNVKIIESFFSQDVSSDSRHIKRLNKIKDIEKQN